MLAFSPYFFILWTRAVGDHNLKGRELRGPVEIETVIGTSKALCVLCCCCTPKIRREQMQRKGKDGGQWLTNMRVEELLRYGFSVYNSLQHLQRMEYVTNQGEGWRELVWA